MKKIGIIVVFGFIVLNCFVFNVFAVNNNFTNVWDGSVNTDWYTNSKTEYEIRTASELAGLSQLVQDGVSFEGKTVKLLQNIYLNDNANWKSWNADTLNLNEWTPIGSNEKRFKGTFDGNGCSVSGLYISSSSNGVGLFGHVENALIQNIKIVGAYVYGISNVGAVCGYAYESDFSYCHAEANTFGNGVVGCVFGCVERGNNSGIRYLKDCSSKGTVINTVKFESSDSYYLNLNATGGVVGAFSSRENGEEATIERCSNFANIRGTSCVGGVVGKLHTYYTQNITVSDCFNSGDVQSEDIRAGGIIGYNYQDGSLGSSNSVRIDRCVNYGNVHSGDSTLGGILGFAHICRRNTSCSINNSFNIHSSTSIRGSYDKRYSDKVQVNNCTSDTSIDTTQALELLGENWRVEETTGRIQLINSCFHKYGDMENVWGNILIPPIIKERTCSLCGDTQRETTWKYVWVPIVTLIVAVMATIGIVNYVRALKKK